VGLTHCPDCRRLCFDDPASRPGGAVSSRPGALGDAAAADERSFRGRGSIMSPVPFAGAQLALAVVLMRA
jgi:hypothetical protein